LPAKEIRKIRIPESTGDANESYIRELNNEVERTKQAIESIPKLEITVEALRTTLSACRVGDIAAASLSKHPAGDIEIAKEQVVNFAVKGGQPPYRATFLGSPLKGLDLSPVVSLDGIFTLRADKDFSGGEVSVEIGELKSQPATHQFLVKGK